MFSNGHSLHPDTGVIFFSFSCRAQQKSVISSGDSSLVWPTLPSSRWMIN